MHRTRQMTVTLTVCLLAAVAGSLAFGSAGASAATESFRNSTSIGLPGNGSASPYPSTINVPEMEGVVTGVTVTFHGFSHGATRSVNALLVSPDNRKSLVMTWACGPSQPLTTFVFNDRASTDMPENGPCDKILYRPTENTPDGWVDFGSSAPDGPYSANFNNFLGTTAYGAWKLYIKGFGGNSSGKMAGGWSLTLETANPDAVVPRPGRTSNLASSYPLTRTVSGLDGLITDVNVTVPGVYHQNAADLEMMLVSPSGRAVILMSDVCSGDVRYENWNFDDESSAFMSVEQPCASGTYKPVGRADQYFPLAPGVPPGTQTTLSDFDLTAPNGNWNLYVFDDHYLDANAGLFLSRFQLEIETRPKAAVQFANPMLDVEEGKSGELTVTRSAGGAQLIAATVYVTTVPGSAGADDFKQSTVSVDFAPGETDKKVNVDVLADAVRDPGETFDVKFLSTFGDARPAGTTTATVTIGDVAPAGDDAPTGGDPTGGGQGPGPDLAAPQISGPTLSSKRFRVSRLRTAAVARTARGTKIRYSLSEAAAVGLRFQRAVPRRPSGRRWVAAGRLRRAARAGANRVAFSGRIGRRALRPGVYRLIVRATDSAGNSASAKPRAFRVVR